MVVLHWRASCAYLKLDTRYVKVAQFRRVACHPYVELFSEIDDMKMDMHVEKCLAKGVLSQVGAIIDVAICRLRNIACTRHRK